jgi:hypothetical protein
MLLSFVAANAKSAPTSSLRGRKVRRWTTKNKKIHKSKETFF